MENIFSQNPNAFLKKICKIRLFYFLFSLAVIFRIICDIQINRIGIHLGEIFPDRKWNNNTLPYSVLFLYFEWLTTLTGAILLNTRFRRTGSVLIAISLVFSINQMYQNQKALIFIVALLTSILPINFQNIWSTWALKFQLIFVYTFTALQKINPTFLAGEDLKKVLTYISSKEGIHPNFIIESILNSPFILKFFSISTIAIELLIPVLLIKKPKIGFVLVIILHFTFNLFLDDIFPFTLMMIAMASLFLHSLPIPSDTILTKKT